jgi:TIR domain
MVNSRIRSCFITAPAGTNLDVLTDALRRRDIRVVGPKAIPLGTAWETEISDLLTSADLTIGVLTRSRQSDWVLFELGQAWGRGKMVLLFAPPDSAHVPLTLRRFLTVRANLSNQEAIEFALDQILAAPEPTPLPNRPAKEKAPLGASADRYLQGSVPMFASVNPL